MKQVLTHPITLVLVGVLVGAAYGSRIPGVNYVAKKLPGNTVL